jgi:hypothetical protein
MDGHDKEEILPSIVNQLLFSSCVVISLFQWWPIGCDTTDFKVLVMPAIFLSGRWSFLSHAIVVKFTAGTQQGRNDSEVLFQATFEIHQWLLLCLMLPVSFFPDFVI